MECSSRDKNGKNGKNGENGKNGKNGEIRKELRKLDLRKDKGQDTF